jgi:hypothetical protein
MYGNGQRHAMAAALPVNRILGGPKSRSGRFGKEKNALASAVNRSPDRRLRSLAATPTEVQRLPKQNKVFFMVFMSVH